MEGMSVGSDQLFEELHALYESGRYHTAYVRARDVGLLDVSRDARPAQVLLAARLILQAGAPRRARMMVLSTWRRHRRDPEACLRYAYELADHGPLPALRFMEETGELVSGTPEIRSNWLSLRALELSQLRDFRQADDAWKAAMEVSVQPWTWCVRAMIDGARDQTGQAIDSIRKARAVAPWYRPAVAIEAEMMLRERRVDEATGLLVEASRRLESASIELSLHFRYRERQDHDAALGCIERVIRYSPLMERGVHIQVAALLSDVQYLRGDDALSAHLASLTPFEALHRMTARALSDRHGKRIQLAVSQVPQHHNTCAPATLTSIAEFWGARVTHVELAEEICHDGTPAISERRWTIARGFAVREFTVTWNSAVALLDAGLPFSMVSEFATSAHLQAVIGYDARRRSLLIRDPSSLSLSEYEWESIERSEGPFGPRGLLFVPKEQEALIEQIRLPDAALYDDHFAVENALEEHDRDTARLAYERLVAVAPDHRLRLQARRALAHYDGDDRGALEWSDAMLARFPEDIRLLVRKLWLLDRVASRAERLELTERLLAKADLDPTVLADCAEVIAETADGAARARRLALRSIRRAPTRQLGYRVLAGILWDEGERAGAARLYRIASCLAEGSEPAAWSYFLAARLAGTLDDALEHLRDRVARMSARSALPAQTLCEAYRVLNRWDEAFRLLDEALAVHPDDGALLQVMSEQYRSAGDMDRARELLERARPHSNDRHWRRGAAELAAHAGRLEEALGYWRELAERDPMDAQSQSELVRGLVRTGDVDAATAHLRRQCQEHPYFVPVHRLLIDHIAEHAPGELREHLEEFVRRHPTSGWGLLRLVALHRDAGELVLARECLERARVCETDRAAIACAEGDLLIREGHRDPARERFREGIRADVDHPRAISRLLDLATTAADGVKELDFIAREIERQGTSGSALLAYAGDLDRWLDPRSALARVQALRQRYADLWVAWSVEISALVRAERGDTALELARRAVARFELTPGAWRQLASLHEQRDERRAQVAALERAIEINPHWLEAHQALAEALDKAGEPERARAAMERAIAEDPLAAVNYGYLAELAWSREAKEETRRHLERALVLEPEYQWAWDRLRRWFERDVVVAAARAACERSPRAIRARFVLAELDDEASVGERVARLDEVLAHDPSHTEASDTKARLLAEAGRWDEALAACAPSFWKGEVPFTLRGRAAWIREARGDREGAIEDMLSVLATATQYEWGMQRLMEWAQAEGNARYLEVAEKAAPLAPTMAAAIAHLGEAQRLNDDSSSAERSFTRSLALDASNVLARLGMFDIHLDRGEVTQAAPYLEDLDDDNPWVVARQVQLHVAQDRLEDADQAFHRVCELDWGTALPINEAFDGFERAGHKERARALLIEAAAKEGASELVAAVWWRRLGVFKSRHWRWRQIRRMAPSKGRAACFHEQVEDYMRKGLHWTFLAFILSRWRILRSQTDLWGTIGYGLLRMNSPNLAIRWMRSYPSRGGVAPWMLLNLASAKLWVGRARDAWAVFRDALTLPADNTTYRHQLYLAGPEAVLGEVREARALLERALPHVTTEEDRFLAGFAEAIIAFERSRKPEAERRAEFNDAMRALWDAIPGGENRSKLSRATRIHYGKMAALLRSTNNRLSSGPSELRER